MNAEQAAREVEKLHPDFLNRIVKEKMKMKLMAARVYPHLHRTTILPDLTL